LDHGTIGREPCLGDLGQGAAGDLVGKAWRDAEDRAVGQHPGGAGCRAAVREPSDVDERREAVPIGPVGAEEADAVTVEVEDPELAVEPAERRGAAELARPFALPADGGERPAIGGPAADRRLLAVE